MEAQTKCMPVPQWEDRFYTEGMNKLFIVLLLLPVPDLRVGA